MLSSVKLMIAFGGNKDRGALNEKVLINPLLSGLACCFVPSGGVEDDRKDSIRRVKDARTKVSRIRTRGVLMMAMMWLPPGYGTGRSAPRLCMTRMRQHSAKTDRRYSQMYNAHRSIAVEV